MMTCTDKNFDYTLPVGTLQQIITYFFDTSAILAVIYNTNKTTLASITK